MKTIKFGVIGCGLMGKEFASAAARWCHLSEEISRPEIVAVCDFNEGATGWFQNNFPTVNFVTKDYKELLQRADVEAVIALCRIIYTRRCTWILFVRVSICWAKNRLG